MQNSTNQQPTAPGWSEGVIARYLHLVGEALGDPRATVDIDDRTGRR